MTASINGGHDTSDQTAGDQTQTAVSAGASTGADLARGAEAPVERPSVGRRLTGFFGSAHGLFLVVGAVFLGVFVTLVPPGWGLDEQAHFYRMYQISQGKLFPDFDPTGQMYVAPIPRPIYDLLQQGWAESNAVPREEQFYHRNDLKDTAPYEKLESQSIDPNDVVSADVTQTLPNFPVVYFASSAGLRLAALFGADIGGMVLAAKVCAALMYLGMAFVAIWFARRLRLRWLVLTVALLPAAIFQASVITADTFANGAALLFLSVVCTLLIERRPAGMGTLVLLTAAAVAVVLSKPTYALLVGLVAVLPAVVFSSRARAVWYKTGVLIGALVLIGITLYIAGKGTLAINTQRPDYAASINAGAQLKGVLTNPAHALLVVATTVIYYGQSWVQGVVGLFGYNTIPVTVPFVFSTVLAIFLAAFYAERMRRLPGWATLLAGCAVALGIIMTFYLTFSVVGAESAIGIQGRYFIPCVLPLALGLAAVIPVRAVMRPGTARVLFTSLSTVTLLVAALTYAIALY